MIFTDEYLQLLVASYIYPFLRVSSVFVSSPIFGTKIVPSPAKITSSLFITVIAVSLIPEKVYPDPFSTGGVLLAIQQIIIGLSIGFMIRLIFSVLETGGHIIGQTMGLGFAQMVDPGNGVAVPAVSQFYTVVATLLFLTMNGHIVIIEIIVQSFSILPVQMEFYRNFDLWKLVSWSSWLFKGAIIISIPVVASLLLVQISFGVMMRAAPQLNIFAVGFPITLIMGFVLIYLSLPYFIEQFTAIFQSSVNEIGSMLGA